MPSAPWPPSFEAMLRTYLEVGDGESISPEITLMEHGLDSMGTVNLLLDLEAEYAVTIPDERLMNFATTNVGSLWAMVEQAAAVDQSQCLDTEGAGR